MTDPQPQPGASVAAAVIDGNPVDISGAATMPSINPATGARLGDVVISAASVVDAAVASAASAQREWAALLGRERARVLWQWGDLIEAHIGELVAIDVADVGKVATDAAAEMRGAARMARYWSGTVERLLGHTIPTVANHLSYTTREPLGVVGAILPWNAPAAVCVARCAPALACGNAVVVKPSENSPRSALRLAELGYQAGMPVGLFNVVTGDASTGGLVAAHPGINGICFVGSVAAGRAVGQAATGHFAKLLLELGGKAPNIVFADADLPSAIKGSTWGIFQNAGQICAASSRLLVEESVAEDVVEQITARARRVRVGDPNSLQTQIGPVVSRRQYDRVLAYIGDGRSQGATVRVGGGRPDDVHPDGLFVAPTVFTDVDAEMRIAEEEIFGPVLSVFTFRGEAAAIELANRLDFGLTASIWTSRIDRALGIADQIEAGSVFVNSPLVLDPSLPFGGFKNSGVGNGNGLEVLDELTQTKRVSINYGATTPSWSD